VPLRRDQLRLILCVDATADHRQTASAKTEILVAM